MQAHANHPLLMGSADDPPPFPASRPQLQRLDRAHQCQICKEPFIGPVSIACGHSFCSQCIRSALNTTKKCPVCGEPASEGAIRRNRALEEMVDAWEEARPVLITLSKPAPTRKRPADTSRAGASADRVKRLKKEDGHSSGRSRSTSAVPSGASASESPEAEEEVMDGAAGVIELGSSDTEEVADVGEKEEEQGELGDDDEGECPLCQARLPIAGIPAHIERGCPPVKKAAGTGNQKADWKKVFGGVGAAKQKELPVKRLTKPNLSLSSPSDLRAFLATHSLPTTGDRPQLELRVQEWITLFNANLDTAHPRSLAALRARLAEGETSRRRDKDKGREAMADKLGTARGMAEYARERRGEFERLRDEVIRRRQQKEGQGGDGQGHGQGQGEGEGKESAIEVE